MTTLTQQDDALAARLAEAALGEDVTHNGVTYRKILITTTLRLRADCQACVCPLVARMGTEDACDRHMRRSPDELTPCDMRVDRAHYARARPTIAAVDRIPYLAMKGLLA